MKFENTHTHMYHCIYIYIYMYVYIYILYFSNIFKLYKSMLLYNQIMMLEVPWIGGYGTE